MPKLFKAQKPKTDTAAGAKKPEGKSKIQYGLFLYNDDYSNQSDPQKQWQLFHENMLLSSYNTRSRGKTTLEGRACVKGFSLIVAPMKAVKYIDNKEFLYFTNKINELNDLGVYSLFLASQNRAVGMHEDYRITFNPEFTGFFDYMANVTNVSKDSWTFADKIINMLIPAEYTDDENAPIESWNKLEKLIMEYNKYVTDVLEQVDLYLPTVVSKVVLEYSEHTSFQP